MSSPDRDLTRKIRQALMVDKSIAIHVRGFAPMKSTIEGKATEFAGAGKVKNEISVKK
jgi:hypothetical protein